MTRRALFHTLFALLLMLAGPVSASHSEMMTSDSHCEEMASDHSMAGEAGHASMDHSSMDHALMDQASMDEASMDKGQDCDSQCQCCPGTCSATPMLSQHPTTFPLTATAPAVNGLFSAPRRAPTELLRPPISA